MGPVECVPEDAFGETLALPDSDPRRIHITTCPRCRALALSYERFMAADDDAHYGSHERATLDAARARLLGVPSDAHAPAAGSGPRTVPLRTRSAWTSGFDRGFRPALAAAAVLVALIGVWALPRMRSPAPAPVVRGPGSHPLALTEPRYGRDQSVRLEWRSFTGAEAYEVRLFSTGLESIGILKAGAETTLTLGSDRLPDAFRRGTPILYRVAALRGGDEVALSATGTIQRP